MAKSDQDITLDEKSQEQPQTKERARDPSSKDQPQPPTREEEKTGKVAPGQKHQRHLGDKS
ncbi:hypothetical protein RPMA_18875 [Tardiphaga alba]|uniref:Uncharacterized protein n=1 Tax=Tardiphaga alba TaxID=340268 RepID=A0ABX8AAI5_9BRAD|nr:hypothetical protein [Tardiphaga alba]QUS40663.1 hypothetical protein RPMA_18875 [Tardiphaga alba]